MRDLNAYPITTNEIIGLLQRLRHEAIREAQEQRIIGDMRPAILTAAIRLLKTVRTPVELTANDE